MGKISFNTDLSVEQLENDVWKHLSFPTPLVEKVYQYRRIPVQELTIEQIRLLISQSTGLKFLVPFAITILSDNPLAEGDYYEGDLLNAVLDADTGYWKDNADVKDLFLEKAGFWRSFIEARNEGNIHRRVLEKLSQPLNHI